MNGFSLREHAPSILVATLSSAFGVAVLQFFGVLSQLIMADDVTGSSDTVAYLLGFVAWVFIAIAVYTGAVVTSNTFSTIIAGRTRTIALMRLIGSSARAQRAAVAREGLLVGAIGSVIGAVVGSVVTIATVTGGKFLSVIPELDFRYFDWSLLLPVVTVVLTTWAASWVGSRRVLVVSPMQAIGASTEQSREEASASKGRSAAAVALFGTGIAILVLSMLLGLVTPLAVLIGIVGGLLSFTGLVTGAHLVMPPALRLVGRLLGSSASSRLAAENAVRYPERSSRTTIGLVIGVTLVTMFAVALQSYQNMLYAAQANNPTYYAGIDESLLLTVIIFSVLVGFSAVIAAVGMVNNLSLSVLQRTRELGLLRALGFTARQVRSMILAESAQLTLASVLVGLVLGTFYGWAGAQSLLGSINGSPGIVVPGIPLVFLAGVVVLAGILTVSASVGPSRRATRIAPVAALAVQ
ncbi:FtsX-like permease family protein [Glaciihabitans arcticus]|uniref:FtsX-like permease family protein n=1 Tax=Glaciihabitans arcticus TaxID=2668039 RepID=A0A4Q9GW97_9MICO|nr:FtsX-like permease family protein [Glaciihabitans arcticus]TBN56953.1 FtsX-like permease family protein [Glaciihabitans arcticus]